MSSILLGTKRQEWNKIGLNLEIEITNLKKRFWHTEVKEANKQTLHLGRKLLQVEQKTGNVFS